MKNILKKIAIYSTVYSIVIILMLWWTTPPKFELPEFAKDNVYFVYNEYTKYKDGEPSKILLYLEDLTIKEFALLSVIVEEVYGLKSSDELFMMFKGRKRNVNYEKKKREI